MCLKSLKYLLSGHLQKKFADLIHFHPTTVATSFVQV